MDNNLLQELEEHFNAFINLKDYNQFNTGIVSYFRFIDNKYPLNKVAENLFLSPSSPSILGNINGLYKWFLGGAPRPNISISPMSVQGSGIYIFHNSMIEGAKRLGFRSKGKVILHTATNNKSVCLEGEELRCYSLKRDDPKRFKIILILFRTETGKPASEIACLLGKENPTKTEQDNIKKEIKMINTLFQNHCDVSGELIVHTKMKGKNIYSLNRELFIFEKEK
jgi:hypothetical protein